MTRVDILRTFEQLELILASQQVQGNAAADPTRRHAAAEELAVLSAALTHLFSSSTNVLPLPIFFFIPIASSWPPLIENVF